MCLSKLLGLMRKLVKTHISSALDGPRNTDLPLIVQVYVKSCSCNPLTQSHEDMGVFDTDL